MLAMFLLAAVSRCASESLCPTDVDLIAALRSRDGQRDMEAMRAAQAEDPDSIVFVHSERIHGIRDVHCGRPWLMAEKKITCSFTVKRWSHVTYEVAELKMNAEGWSIEAGMNVLRKLRR